MLPEEIVLVKPVFTSTQNPKNKENLKFLILLPIFLCLVASPGAAASGNWELIPENPVAGDIMEIRGTGFAGEAVKVVVTFEKEVQVLDGRYEYLLEDIIIPSGFGNSFIVQATGADDLNVRAKMLLWITKTGKAKDGIATVSQTNVPPGTYKIRMDGKASAPNVKLKITASQEVEVDSGGSFSYTYNTKSIPPGIFEVEVGGIAKQVELKPGESLSSEITPSPEQNLSEEKTEEITPSLEQNSNGRKTEGINKVKISSENHTLGNTSSMKNKDSSILGINSILETPKTFIPSSIKSHIQAKGLIEVIRNPPKVPSFLLGFTLTLLIGLAILKKRR